MVVPPKHPKMIIFSGKTNGCWVPPFLETPISPVSKLPTSSVADDWYGRAVSITWSIKACLHRVCMPCQSFAIIMRTELHLHHSKHIKIIKYYKSIQIIIRISILVFFNISISECSTTGCLLYLFFLFFGCCLFEDLNVHAKNRKVELAAIDMPQPVKSTKRTQFSTRPGTIK